MRKVITKEEYCGLDVEVLRFEAADLIITSDTETGVYPANGTSYGSSYNPVQSMNLF